jgi:hypothetical protein
MTWDDFKQQDLERDEKNPRATIDATGAEAQNVATSKPAPKSIWRKIMAVLTPKERGEKYKHEKAERERRALTIVGDVSSQAAPKAASDETSIAIQSSTNVHRFVKPEPVLGEYRTIVENSPAPISDRWYSNIPLHLVAFAFFVTGICISGWYTHSQGSTVIAAWLFFALGVTAETALFFFPDYAAVRCRQRRYGASLVLWLLCPFMVAFVFQNNIGFSSVNVADTTETRAGRTTPAIQEASRALEDAKGARDRECGKVGPVCRTREDAVTDRQKKLDNARDAVAAEANPQAAKTAKLVAWATPWKPSVEDVAMFYLVLSAFLPLCAGLIRMAARRR